MRNEIQATIIRTDPTDVTSAIDRIEELRKLLVEKEQAASKARRDLENCEQNARTGLKNHPALLAELEAELTALANRREERNAREARIEAIRKQPQQ